jgi:hypothetical protein
MVGASHKPSANMLCEHLAREVDLALFITRVQANPDLTSGRLHIVPFHALHAHKYSSAVLLPSVCSNRKSLALQHVQSSNLIICFVQVADYSLVKLVFLRGWRVTFGHRGA